MNLKRILYFACSCILLTLPVMIFNALFTTRLPQPYQMDVFWKEIPAAVGAGENIFRSLVFFLPLLMPLKISTRSQKIGLSVFIAGTLIYFLSWGAQIAFPHSAWSTSIAGFLAPGYTPLIWLVGIGLIGDRLYFRSPYRSWMYVLLSLIFLAFHLTHASIIYGRFFS